MTLSPSVRKAGPLSLVLFAALALVGCGGAPAAFPSEAPLPSTAEGSLAALEQAEGELMLALGNPAAPMATGSPAAQQGYAQPPPPPVGLDAPPAPSQPTSTSPGGTMLSEQGDADAHKRVGASDPCTSACRALSSMRRATDHLCGLSGDGDERCQNARRRVESASSRVRASCPMCSAARS